jgi:hypothetical protein
VIECRHCHRVFRDDPASLGARCPRCRAPLYERAEAGRPPLAAGMQACATHANRPAVGVCRICRTHVCALCRTRWRDQAVCPACAERELARPDRGAADERSQRRLAMWSLIFGIAAWLLLALSVLPFLLGRPPSKELAILLLLVLLVSAVPALFAASHGAAAVRARGDRLRAATTGLVLGGSHLGLLLGTLLLVFWAN